MNIGRSRVTRELPPSPCAAARERSGRARLQGAEDAELYTPAESLFPSYDERRARAVSPGISAAARDDGSRRRARGARARAAKSLGSTSFPPLVLLTDDTPAADHAFGISAGIPAPQSRPRRSASTGRTSGSASRSKKPASSTSCSKGWSADYDDPLSFADLFASWNLNNHGRYNNPELDAQVRIAQQSLDESVRLNAFAEIQRILIEDAVTILAYERGVMYVAGPAPEERRAPRHGPAARLLHGVHRRGPLARVLAYILKRLVQGVITVWFIATATFVAMHAVPGDPLTRRAHRQRRRSAPTSRRATGSTDRCSSSTSSTSATCCAAISASRSRSRIGASTTSSASTFPCPRRSAFSRWSFAAFGGVLWGALTAIYRNRLPDVVIMFLVIVGISVPSFVVAALSQLALVNLNSWRSARRCCRSPAGERFGTCSCPRSCSGLSTMAYLTRLMRSSMLEIVDVGFHAHGAREGLAADAHFSAAPTAQRDLAGRHGARPADRADHDGRLRRRARVRDPGSRPVLRRSRSAARLHGDHGHDGVLRRVPGVHGASSSTSSTASSTRG